MTISSTTSQSFSFVENKFILLTTTVVFVVLTALAAQCEIPIYPVPITLQTFFVFLAGGILQRKAAVASMVLYVFAGAVGLPVFAGGSFGVAKLLGPSGGYLWSFPLAVAVIATITEKRKNFGWMMFAMTIGSLIIFFCGTLQLNAVFFHDWNRSLQSGFFIFSVWDIVKLVAAASIATQYHKILR